MVSLSSLTLIPTALCGLNVPTNKINKTHLKPNNQSLYRQHTFLRNCRAYLHNWSASVNQHCRTLLCELNLEKKCQYMPAALLSRVVVPNYSTHHGVNNISV